MNLDSLACGNCGASLNVPDGVRFVSCLHCGSSLQVQRNESVAYTEVAEMLEGHTQEISALRETIDIQHRIQEHQQFQRELNQLDHEWEQLKQTMFEPLFYGRRDPSNSRESLQKIVFLLLCVVALCGLMAAVADTREYCTGLLVVLLAFLGREIANWIRVMRYESSLREYRDKRQAIVASMPR